MINACKRYVTASWRRHTRTSSSVSSLFRDFDPSVTSALLHDGYAVVDKALVDGDQMTEQLRREIDKLPLVPNETHFTSSESTLRLAKSHIREMELHLATDAVRATVPNLVKLEQDTALRAMISVYIPAVTLRQQALKAQFNAGSGGCFPIHLDTDPSVDNRIITAILYLNEDWDSSSQGGQLRVFPYPSLSAIDIDPVDGRLVLLSSTEMHHCVLPARAPRYAVTLWLFGMSSPKIPKPPTVDAQSSDLARIFLLPRYRKHVARIALSDEWIKSLRAAHPPEQAEVAVRAHLQVVSKTQAALIEGVCRSFVNVARTDVEAVLCNTGNELERLMAPYARAVPWEQMVVQWL